MAWIEIGGIGIAYDIIGRGPRTAAITPGGRFSKDAAGIRALAGAIAAGGFRVLIWDRPNCGESDIAVAGTSESIQNADMLAGLLRALDLGPALLVGGSGGARETLLTTVRHPALVERVFVLWLSGGAVGIATLPSFYCADAIVAATHGGMAAVVELPGWQEPLTRNPGNRARMLALDPAVFIATMTRWAEACFPASDVPVPLLSRDDLASIAVPVMVLRSGASDMHHSRATSEAIARLIPGAHLAEPPWGDREWVEKLVGNLKGEAGLFSRWPLMAPMILDFAAQR